MLTFGSETDNWSGVTLEVLNDPQNEIGLLGFYFTSDDYDVDDVMLEVFYTRAVSMPVGSSRNLVLVGLLLRKPSVRGPTSGFLSH